MELAEKLRELYNENPECIGNLNHSNCGKSLQERLKKIKLEPPKDFKLKTLDHYSLNDSLTSMIGHLPSKKVESFFGKKVLFWAAKRSHNDLVHNYSFKDLKEVFGERVDDIEKIRHYYWRFFFNSNSEDAFNLWEVYNKVDENFTKNYDFIGNLINAFQGVNKRVLGKEKARERKVIATLPQTGLSPFHWKKSLFEVVSKFGEGNGFNRIGVESANNNQ